MKSSILGTPKMQLIQTILLTLIGFSVLTFYNANTIRSKAEADIKSIGITNCRNISEQLDSYFEKGAEALEATANTAEYFLNSGAETDVIGSYLAYSSSRLSERADEGFLGLRGWVNGSYFNGTGFETISDAELKASNWYIPAVNAGGSVVISSPFTDGSFQKTVVCISKLLSDGTTVLSLELSAEPLRNLSSAYDGSESFFVICDENGFVIAHTDASEIGKNYRSGSNMDELGKCMISDVEAADIVINDSDYVVFSETVRDNWHVASVIDTDEFYHDVNNTFNNSIIISVIVYIIIVSLGVVFYICLRKRITQLQKTEHESRLIMEQAIAALSSTVDAKDHYTSGHSKRVAEYSRLIARHMGKSQKEQENIYYAGLLHDVGKIRIPDEIINKPGKLTDEEYDNVKLHPVTGYHILKGISAVMKFSFSDGVRFHHERFDGRGYPNGLQGRNIPEIARIIGVADAYDAMASNRSYRQYLPQKVVRAEIEKGRGTQFDPEIADIMLKIIDEDKGYTLREFDDHEKTILVVDDAPMNVKMVELALKDERMYHIIGASSGKEAIEILNNERVDLILLDIQMPEMDGFETLQEIRKCRRVPPVVFMTSDRDIDTIQKAEELGVVDYITKPFFPLTLKEVIYSTIR